MNEQSMLLIGDVLNIAFAASFVFALAYVVLVLLARRAEKRRRSATPPAADEATGPDR